MDRLDHYYGWVPDLDDERDFVYVAPAAIMEALPPSVDLRPLCPPVFDQGRLGSCTANAIAAALAFEQRKLDAPMQFTPSRLFIYYNERALLNTIATDTGAPLRDGMKAVNRIGVCPEDQPADAANWPYDPAQFASRPPEGCYAAARHVRALRYRRLRRAPEVLKGCLAEGYPFVCGLVVYESFEGAEPRQTGMIQLPAAQERLIGGHAVMVVGYDDARKAFIVRNSWGPDWGDHGYGYLPYEYVFARRLARDFWTIHLISDTLETEAAAAATVAPSPHSPGETLPTSPSAGAQ